MRWWCVDASDGALIYSISSERRTSRKFQMQKSLTIIHPLRHQHQMWELGSKKTTREEFKREDFHLPSRSSHAWRILLLYRQLALGKNNSQNLMLPLRRTHLWREFFTGGRQQSKEMMAKENTHTGIEICRHSNSFARCLVIQPWNYEKIF